MHNFDFDILEPTEFERLVADLVTARENTLKQTSFTVLTQSGGPDGGIDFKINNGKIIGQAKRIKDKHDLFKILRKEVLKLKTLMPERYILIVSLPLTFKQRDEIIELFSPFIRDESDLLDKDDLNSLLENHKDILLQHNKLWLSGTHILQEVITEAVNKAVNGLSGQNTIAELQEISRVREYFVSTAYFPKGIDILRRKGFLIITGDPGIGKTTLARALCHYFMEEAGYRKLYYHHGINPLYMPDEKDRSVFFLDDFLGSNIHDKARIENIGFFEKFIDKVYKDGHLLIVTTREYIYQQEKKVNPRFRQLDIFKQTISHLGYSKEEKLQILLNNVAKAELPYAAVQSLKTFADSIINTPNYQPKLIADFLKRRNDTIPDMNMWGWFLYHYMITPYKYWELTFLDLSDGAKLFVLCLFISNQPTYHNFLFDTFKSVARFRSVSKAGYEGDVFYESIRELNDTFIIIDKDISNDEMVYSFATTTIVDFILSYLKEHDYLIESLIRGAITFDQLFFAFTTRKNDFIADEDSGEELYGEKILLSNPLQKLFIEKVTTEFDDLKEEKVDMLRQGDQQLIIQKRYRDINRVKWLGLLIELFNPNAHSKVRVFLQRKVKEFFLWENESAYLNEEEISKLPDFIFLVRDYLDIDVEKVIDEYCWNMSKTEDYIGFYKFRKLAPNYFDAYVNKHKIEFFGNLRSMIDNDINHFRGFTSVYVDYYKWLQLQNLFDYVILKVYKLYDLQLSEYTWKKWLNEAGMEYREMKIKNTEKDLESSQKETMTLDIKQAVDNVLPLLEEKLSKDELHQLVSNLYPDKKDKIISILQEYKFLYKIIKTKFQLAPIIDYCISTTFPLKKQKECFIKDYCSYELNQLGCTSKDYEDLVEFVSYAHSWKMNFFRKNDMYEYARLNDLDRKVFDKIADSKLMSLNNTWYSFTIPEVKDFFYALSFLNVPDKTAKYSTYTFGYEDCDGFKDILPYLIGIDQKDFLMYFVVPRLIKFYKVANAREDKNIIIGYLKYFDAQLEYKKTKRSIKCTITVGRNRETSLLLDYLKFWIGEALLKKFPYNSSYEMTEENELNCNNLINYIGDIFPEDKTIKMNTITDETFWKLILLTDWGQTIIEQVAEIKLEIGRLEEIIQKYTEREEK